MARIAKLGSLMECERALSEIEAIFFTSAATQQFASPEARAAYRELWLGRYLQHCAQECFAAIGEDGSVTGYIVGSLLSNAGPAPVPDYYAQFDEALTANYPAHIHVNVRADSRGGGHGERLIAAFRAHCRARGVSGFHAVTAADSRAAVFFVKCGFAARQTIKWQSKQIVFLGERLI